MQATCKPILPNGPRPYYAFSPNIDLACHKEGLYEPDSTVEGIHG